MTGEGKGSVIPRNIGIFLTQRRDAEKISA